MCAHDTHIGTHSSVVSIIFFLSLRKAVAIRRNRDFFTEPPNLQLFVAKCGEESRYVCDSLAEGLVTAERGGRQDLAASPIQGRLSSSLLLHNIYFTPKNYKLFSIFL